MVSKTIIVPTLNEAGNVSLLLEQMREKIPHFPDDYEVVFSDSGSIDGTCFEVKSWQNKLPVRLFQTEKNLGLAKAVLAAAKVANGETIVVMDCDLSHPVEKVPELLRLIEQEGFDMTIGSRYVEGGGTPDWPFKRRLISRLATIPAKCFTDVQDPMAGFFAVKKSYLKNAESITGGFKICFEIITQNKTDFTYKEIPIIFRDRELGKSKMGKRVIFEYLRQLFRLTFSS